MAPTNVYYKGEKFSAGEKLRPAKKDLCSCKKRHMLLFDLVENVAEYEGDKN